VAPELPFSVHRIDHVVLRVRNPRASIAFYRDVLGCNLVRERPDLGLFHIRAGASMIDLVDVDGELGRRGGAAPGQDARNVDHVCLRVEPFDETLLRQHLMARGVIPIGAASRNFGAEGDGLSLYIRDPDGNIVELKGPADSAATADTGI
jgi:glyoxylase I family protein